MTSMQEKSMGSVTYYDTGAADHTAHHDTEQNPPDDSPQTALERVLLFNNALANYPTKTKVDPRIHELIQLQKLIKTLDMLDEVIDQSNSDIETRQAAEELKGRLSDRFDATTMEKTGISDQLSDAHLLHAALLIGEAQSTNPDQYGDIYDYENTVTTSGILLAEQLQKFSSNLPEGQSSGQIQKNDVKDVIRQLDIDIIVKTTEQRANYTEAHKHPSLSAKGQAFAKLLDSLNDTMVSINKKGGLPITEAVNHLISAKALHDLALLGEFGSKETRDIALRAAVNDLWDAKTKVESSTHTSEATVGILNDIKDYIGRYSRELGVDPTVRPAGKIYEITDPQKSHAIRNLGAAAYSNTANDMAPTQLHAA